MLTTSRRINLEANWDARMRPRLVVSITVVALALQGCGGNDDDGAQARSATTAAPAAGAALPDELLGTYTVRLSEDDLPADPPPELTDGGPKWVLTVAPDGGADGAPSFTIASAEEAFGVLETSTPS